MSKLYRIYTINDNLGNPVYVGRTTDTIHKRLISHKCKGRMSGWLKSNKHSIELLEETYDKSSETFYITTMSNWGFNLFNIGQTKRSSKFYKDCAKPVSKLVLDTNTGVFYNSSKELERLLNVSDGSIRRKLNGSRKNNTQFIQL